MSIPTPHSRRISLWAGLLCLASCFPTDGGQLVELQDDEGKYVGQVVAVGEKELWLQESSGALRLLVKEKIASFKKREGSFRLMSATDLRGALRKELGSGLEVRGTGHYLVCGHPRSVEQFAPVFEEVYRSFVSYFRVRGIPLEEPSQPLVAVVLPNQKAFAEYALRDGVYAGRGLGGYYIRTTNRVALFEEDQRAEGELLLPEMGIPPVVGGRRDLGAWSEGSGAFATIEGNLRNTIVHEVTHQVAFNTGVHNRMAENPKWFVEGLACVFEAPGIRDGDPLGKVGTRVNRERLEWFKGYRKNHRPEKFLKPFVSSDLAFEAAVLDAYAESWALTFFLVETRRREYGAYVKKVAARPPLQEYSPEERIEDFEGAFGKDWSRLETSYLRYLDELR